MREYEKYVKVRQWRDEEDEDNEEKMRGDKEKRVRDRREIKF